MEQTSKCCIVCNVVKSLTEFYFRKETNRYRNDCKQCNNKSRYFRKSKTKHLRSLKEKELRKTNPQFRLDSNLRRRIHHALKGTSKSSSAASLLGCDINFFREYIESKFLPGMSWDNYGLRGWHVDHIKPCASFDLTNPQEQVICFHYSNLRPLWAKDNLSKGKKYGTKNNLL